jgi:DNA-binding PadR family transcriptional regulator
MKSSLYVVDGIEKRILNEFMDLLVLSMAHAVDGEISGYDVIKYLHRRFRFLPSAGSVYSLLYAMERKGLLRGEWGGRKRVYRLTRKGKETFRIIFSARDRIVTFVSAVFSERGFSRLQLQPLILASSKESSAEP